MAQGASGVRDQWTESAYWQTHVSVNDEVHGRVYQETAKLYVRYVRCRNYRSRILRRGVGIPRGEVVQW